MRCEVHDNTLLHSPVLSWEQLMNGPHPSSIRPPSYLSDMPQNLLFESATDGNDEVFISHYVDALPFCCIRAKRAVIID